MKLKYLILITFAITFVCIRGLLAQNVETIFIGDIERGGYTVDEIDIRGGVRFVGNSWAKIVVDNVEQVETIGVHARNAATGDAGIPKFTLNTAPDPGNTAVEIANKNFQWYDFAPLANSTYIYHLDVNQVGFDSNIFVDSVRITYKVTLPPDTSTAVDTTVSAHVVILGWDPNPEPDMDLYKILVSMDGGIQDVGYFVQATATPMFEVPFSDEGVYRFKIYAQDNTGNISDYTPFSYRLNHPVIADKIPPSNPTGVGATSIIILNLNVSQ